MFARSLICLGSFTVAALFGIAMTAIYGAEAFSELKWIDSVFWALAASGPGAIVIASIKKHMQRRYSPRESSEWVDTTY